MCIHFQLDKEDVNTWNFHSHEVTDEITVVTNIDCISVVPTNMFLLLSLASVSLRGSHLVQSEEVEELVCAHALQAGVVLADDSVGDAHLEFLQTHDLLLQCASCDQPVHVHHSFLHNTNTMRKVN